MPSKRTEPFQDQLSLPMEEASEQAKNSVPETVPTPPPTPEPIVDWRTKVPSVSQLTRLIRGQVENSFSDVWVKGEISNFRKPVSGHAYFVVKDATAQLRAVMFRGALTKVKFQLQDGMEILIHGSISVYEARGEYQLVADAIEPVGVGALQLAFEQLRLKLQREGLFEQTRKKPLPYLPKRIGIITSATGAAVRDILKVLSRRYSNREIFIIPANVQGEKAAPDIVHGIQLAERYNRENPEKPIEVLIVGRGGGSLEDLWPFNEEIVARALFVCPIPTISAVGHEIDFTIADFVADYRAPTPSAAAEIVVPKKEELLNNIEQQNIRLRQAMKKHIQQWRLHLGHLSSRLIDPRKKIRETWERFRLLEGRMVASIRAQLLLSKRQLESKIQMLHTLSPLQVIGRGFSLTRNLEGSVIRSVSAAPPGTKLLTQVGDGEFYSEVLPSHNLKDR